MRSRTRSATGGRAMARSRPTAGTGKRDARSFEARGSREDLPRSLRCFCSLRGSIAQFDIVTSPTASSPGVRRPSVSAPPSSDSGLSRTPGLQHGGRRSASIDRYPAIHKPFADPMTAAAPRAATGPVSCTCRQVWVLAGHSPQPRPPFAHGCRATSRACCGAACPYSAALQRIAVSGETSVSSPTPTSTRQMGSPNKSTAKATTTGAATRPLSRCPLLRNPSAFHPPPKSRRVCAAQEFKTQCQPILPHHLFRLSKASSPFARTPVPHPPLPKFLPPAVETNTLVPGLPTSSQPSSCVFNTYDCPP